MNAVSKTSKLEIFYVNAAEAKLELQFASTHNSVLGNYI